MDDGVRVGSTDADVDGAGVGSGVSGSSDGPDPATGATFTVGDLVVSAWSHNRGQVGTVKMVGPTWVTVKFDDDKPPCLMKPTEIVPALSDEPIPFLLNTYDVTEPAEPWTDWVANPPHYTQHPSGIECIEVTRHMNFCLGNATKYIWRTDLKGDPVENIRKAIFYLQRELENREA